ncbi:hypothetical protein [Rhizobium laguerreae]|uniref:hypothetical protein n=1 Tax=Rhizobium laguerreae TaxID=1076926 RepID=UPI0035E4611D
MDVGPRTGLLLLRRGNRWARACETCCSPLRPCFLTTPDIDVDFGHRRREQLTRWTYPSYSGEKAAPCATIIRY